MTFVLAVPAAVRAGADPWTPERASDAKDPFEQGRALREKGDCAAAVPLFQKAHEAFPTGLGSLRNVAECEETLSHWAASRRAWLELKRALLFETSPKYDGWSTDAQTAAARLEPKVARVTIHVSRDSVAAPLHVSLNDEPVELALLDAPLERDEGAYVVRASDEGGPVSEAQVQLVAGTTQRVELRVRSVVAPPVRPAPSQTLTTVGWIAIGVGALALIGAGVSLAVRQAALGTLTDQCPAYASGSCPSSLEPTVARGKLASALVTGLGIGGGVVLSTGLVLVLTRPKQSRSVALAVSGRAVAMTWTF